MDKQGCKRNCKKSFNPKINRKKKRENYESRKITQAPSPPVFFFFSISSGFFNGISGLVFGFTTSFSLLFSEPLKKALLITMINEMIGSLFTRHKFIRPLLSNNIQAI